MRRFLSVAVLGFCTGCLSDSTAPSVDVNSVVEQTLELDYSTAFSAVAIGSGALAIAPVAPAVCSYSAATQRFECAPATHDGLTFTRAFTLIDASGNSLAAPSLSSIEAIHLISDVKGTTISTASNGQVTNVVIDRHDDGTLSGLQSGVHVLNGTSNQTVDFQFQGGSVRFRDTTVMVNLKVPQFAPGLQWPLGGTITVDQTTTTSASESQEQDILVFDGTSTMTVTRTVAGVTTTCRIDLADPSATNCS